jgi:hypothetical protein
MIATNSRSAEVCKEDAGLLQPLQLSVLHEKKIPFLVIWQSSLGPVRQPPAVEHTPANVAPMTVGALEA